VSERNDVNGDEFFLKVFQGWQRYLSPPRVSAVNCFAIVSESLLGESFWITANFRAFRPRIAVAVKRHSSNLEPLATLFEFGCPVGFANRPQVTALVFSGPSYTLTVDPGTSSLTVGGGLYNESSTTQTIVASGASSAGAATSFISGSGTYNGVNFISGAGTTANGAGGTTTLYGNLGTGTVTANGAGLATAHGGSVNVEGGAGTGTLTANGGTIAGATGGAIEFDGTADHSTITVGAGTAGGGNGAAYFHGTSTGGSATVMNNGLVDLSYTLVETVPPCRAAKKASGVVSTTMSGQRSQSIGSFRAVSHRFRVLPSLVLVICSATVFHVRMA
jgi:hypothetical protein